MVFLQVNSLCGTLCNRTVYQTRNNYNSKFILGKERKVYGEGYYIVWAFFESMYVNEKVEHYSFTFDNLIVSVGGSLGLILGWSLKSVVLDFIEFLYLRMKKKSTMHYETMELGVPNTSKSMYKM